MCAEWGNLNLWGLSSDENWKKHTKVLLRRLPSYSKKIFRSLGHWTLPSGLFSHHFCPSTNLQLNSNLNTEHAFFEKSAQDSAEFSLFRNNFSGIHFHTFDHRYKASWCRPIGRGDVIQDSVGVKFLDLNSGYSTNTPIDLSFDRQHFLSMVLESCVEKKDLCIGYENT